MKPERNLYLIKKVSLIITMKNTFSKYLIPHLKLVYFNVFHVYNHLFLLL